MQRVNRHVLSGKIIRTKQKKTIAEWNFKIQSLPTLEVTIPWERESQCEFPHVRINRYNSTRQGLTLSWFYIWSHLLVRHANNTVSVVRAEGWGRHAVVRTVPWTWRLWAAGLAAPCPAGSAATHAQRCSLAYYTITPTRRPHRAYEDLLLYTWDVSSLPKSRDRASTPLVVYMT